VVDLHESPAVPPEPEGGNPRIGWAITGALALLAGWVGAVGGNLALHRLAPASGWTIGPWWIGRTMGPYAWTTFGIGLAVGAFGAVLLYLASRSPRGPFVLPGYPY
jgi:hypothetical protein